jgi:hypothetical protein
MYEYQEDIEVGIGYLRLKGDRDYTYVFDLGNGRQLQVFYAVYGSEPRNNIELIDDVVQSIRLQQ